MSGLFNAILYQPLFNGLVFLYEYVTFEDLGLAIIVLTIIVRLILYPLSYKAFRNQVLMQRIQPEIKKIQHDHKDNKEKQAELLMKVWKENKVNPFSGFLLILIQLPILIALYRIFFHGFSGDALNNLYSFLPRPEAINDVFLGLINLNKKSIVVVGLAAVLQYIQGYLALRKSGQAAAQSRTSRNMVFLGPVITIIFLSALPSAVGLYWAATSGFSVVQQMIINKSLSKETNHGDGHDSNDRGKTS